MHNFEAYVNTMPIQMGLNLNVNLNPRILILNVFFSGQSSPKGPSFGRFE